MQGMWRVIRAACWDEEMKMKRSWMSLRRVTPLLSIVLLMSVVCCTKHAEKVPSDATEATEPGKIAGDESVSSDASEEWPQAIHDYITERFAAHGLGEYYSESNGVLGEFFVDRDIKDMAKAVAWYQKAAEQGDAAAQFELGRIYTLGFGLPKDESKAVKWFQKAAAQGLAEAQLNLGKCYLEGTGVSMNLTNACEWFEKAAEQGLMEAQHGRGVCDLLGGVGVLTDETKAVQWWQKAAEQGFAAAQYSLGRAYYEGFGVPKDFVLAYAWSNLAAAHTSDTGAAAKKIRDELEERLSAEQLAEAQRLSSNWKIGDLLQR